MEWNIIIFISSRKCEIYTRLAIKPLLLRMPSVGQEERMLVIKILEFVITVENDPPLPCAECHHFASNMQIHLTSCEMMDPNIQIQYGLMEISLMKVLVAYWGLVGMNQYQIIAVAICDTKDPSLQRNHVHKMTMRMMMRKYNVIFNNKQSQLYFNICICV